MELVGGLLARVAIVPAVDLEGAIAQLQAVLGEVAEGLRRIEPAIPVGVVGAGIGGQMGPEPA